MLEAWWRLHDCGVVVSWPGAWALSLMSALAVALARRLRGSGRLGSIARPIARFGMGVLIGGITATGWLLRWQAGCRAVLGAGGGACVLLIRGDPSAGERGVLGADGGACVLVICGDPSAGERGLSSTALMVDVDTGKRLGPVRVLSDAKLENGSSVRAVCRVKALDDSDYARSRFAKGEVASARIVSIFEQGTEARGVSIGSRERGLSSTALMVDVDTGKRLGPVRVLSDAKLENGSSVRAVCRVKALDDSDYARSRFAKGEVASARIVSIFEQGTEARGVSIGSLRARALRVLDAGGSDYRALVAGTVCGRTTELNQSEAQADFSACGLTHLVAVSGSHFGVR